MSVLAQTGFFNKISKLKLHCAVSRFKLHPTGVNNCSSLHLPAGGVSPARPAVLFRTLLPCNSSNNNDKRLQKTAATRNAVPSGPQMNEGNITAWGAGWGATSQQKLLSRFWLFCRPFGCLAG